MARSTSALGDKNDQSAAGGAAVKTPAPALAPPTEAVAAATPAEISVELETTVTALPPVGVQVSV